MKRDSLDLGKMDMGIKGAALAATLATAAGGIMGLYYMLFMARKLRVIRIKMSWKSLRLSMRNIGYQCKIGSSALLGEATMAVLMFVGNQVFMKYLGDDGVGAFGIACYYAPFVFMAGLPLFSLGFICFIMNLTAIGYYQSLEKIGPATIFALLRGLLVLIPAFYLLPMAVGSNGIWLAKPLSETITLFCIFCYYTYRKTKTPSQEV